MKLRDFPRGGEALELFINLPVKGLVLDIGSGQGIHADIMRNSGLEVVTLDSHYPADIQSAWPYEPELEKHFAGIWCCHVLEHSRNPGAFLECCFNSLRTGGWLAVTVPPAKHDIVGGHVSIWNAGLLLYHLILAGFDCRHAMVKSYGYNISIIVRKKAFELPDLAHDEGDIETLATYFPFKARHGFNGDIKELNWGIK